MPEIAKIDLAWEFVHALDPSPAREEALAIIEQAGGKDPSKQREVECSSRKAFDPLVSYPAFGRVG